MFEGVLTLKSDMQQVAVTFPQLRYDIDFLPDTGVNHAIQRQVMETLLAYGEPYSLATLEGGYEVTFRDSDRISVLMHYYSYVEGAAHPNTHTSGLTYDLKNNRMLTLADLFAPESDWVKPLYDLVRADLIRQLMALSPDLTEEAAAQMLTAFGFEPKAEIFGTWNTGPDELILTFDPYAVAPYVFGPLTVRIPYGRIPGLN